MNVKEYEKLSAEFTEHNLLVNQLEVGEKDGKPSAEFQSAKLKLYELREKLDTAQKELSK